MVISGCVTMATLYEYNHTGNSAFQSYGSPLPVANSGQTFTIGNVGTNWFTGNPYDTQFEVYGSAIKVAGISGHGDKRTYPSEKWVEKQKELMKWYREVVLRVNDFG